MFTYAQQNDFGHFFIQIEIILIVVRTFDL